MKLYIFNFIEILTWQHTIFNATFVLNTLRHVKMTQINCMLYLTYAYYRYSNFIENEYDNILYSICLHACNSMSFIQTNSFIAPLNNHNVICYVCQILH